MQTEIQRKLEELENITRKLTDRLNQLERTSGQIIVEAILERVLALERKLK